MAWLWCGLVVLAGGLALVGIRVFFGPRRVRRQLAFPLAVAERTLADALEDLSARRESTDPIALLRFDPLKRHGVDEGAVHVNPFDPLVETLGRFTVADLASLGKEALAEHETLLEAVRTWNATAGRVERVEQLLPVVLTGYQAARQLAARLGKESELARAEAEARLLLSLVGEIEPRGLMH